MSHFTVMVIGEDVEKQLQPYHEYECTGVLDEYVVFVDETKEMMDEFINGTRTMLINFDGELKDPWDDQFYRDPLPEEKENVGMGSGCINGLSFSSRDWGDGLGYRAKVSFIPEDYMEKEVSFRKIYKDVESFCRDWHDDDEENFKDGKIGRLTNPNNKWDWFQVGGRWAGSLMLTKEAIESVNTGGKFIPELPNFSWEWSKEEKLKVLANQCVDIAPKKYIDIDAMEKPMVEKASKQWDGWHSGIKDLPKDNEEKQKWVRDNLGWLVSKLDIERLSTMTRSEYVACKSVWSPYAILWDGTWYSKGKMGWFGMSVDEENNWEGQFKELWNEIPETELVTMVDCHI